MQYKKYSLIFINGQRPLKCNFYEDVNKNLIFLDWYIQIIGFLNKMSFDDNKLEYKTGTLFIEIPYIIYFYSW